MEEKNNEIEIIEGEGPSVAYWFHPVKFDFDKLDFDSEKLEIIGDYWDAVEEAEEAITILLEDCMDFLDYFLVKYFDTKLPENNLRVCNGRYARDFVCYSEHNFYKYNQVAVMLNEISQAAAVLESGDEATFAERFPEGPFVDYHIDLCSNIYHNEDYGLDAIVTFYKKFVARLQKMMENNPQYKLISLMGP